MSDEGRPGAQWARGNQNVQIQGVVGSQIQVTFEGQRRLLPLEPAVVPVGTRVRSPARLLRARSGVVPYAARGDLLEGLVGWVARPEPFAGCVIGGRGGTGKTRLGVELCERAAKAGWVSGLLARGADPAAMEALVEVPASRLVVIDYAEIRAEQLEVVLPSLAVRATSDHPVRVMLLVRAGPRRSSDWTEALRRRGDLLDAVLDDMEVRVLEDEPLDPADRQNLFAAATAAFARRASPEVPPVPAPPELGAAVFASPLLVVVAAYLAVHGEASALPRTRAELLEGLAAHEDRYWEATAVELGTDEALRRRVVALATLAGADGEAEAAKLLGLVPDFAGEGTERRARLARWAHGLYPGSRWWNPIEPDLLAEYLVATCYGDDPGVLAGVLDRPSSASIVRPLETYARAAADHPRLATTLRPVLSEALGRLCSAAVEQAATETDLALLLGGPTLASALERTVATVAVDPNVLSAALDLLPPRSDLVLGPLALTLTSQATEVYRRLAGANPAAYESALASSLNNLSVRLGDAGRRDEGLAAIEEAVEIRRRLAAANPAAYESDLARSLNNLSLRLGEVGRRDEGLAAIEEAVEVYRRLAGANPAAYEPDLASSLNNLSMRLGEAGRRDEGLAAIEEAVEVYRRLAAANPAAYEPDLATSLNNLSLRLGEAGRRDEGLAAIEEAVEVYRRLVAANPAAYEPGLARSLHNLSVDLGEAGRRDEAERARSEAMDIGSGPSAESA